MCCGQCKVEVDHRPQMSSAAISKFALEALWTVRRREAVLLLLLNNWALHHSGNNWFIESSRSVVSLVIIWLFVQTDRLSCHLTGLKRKSSAKIISKHNLVTYQTVENGRLIDWALCLDLYIHLITLMRYHHFIIKAHCALTSSLYHIITSLYCTN